MGHRTTVIFLPGHRRYSASRRDIHELLCSVMDRKRINFRYAETVCIFNFKGRFDEDNVTAFRSRAKEWPNAQIMYRGENDASWSMVNMDHSRCSCHEPQRNSVLALIADAENGAREARQQAESARYRYSALEARFTTALNDKFKQFVDEMNALKEEKEKADMQKLAANNQSWIKKLLT